MCKQGYVAAPGPEDLVDVLGNDCNALIQHIAGSPRSQVTSCLRREKHELVETAYRSQSTVCLVKSATTLAPNPWSSA